MKRRRTPYPPILSVPTTDLEIYRKKIEALFEHYGIVPGETQHISGAGLELILCLASDLFPSFRPSPRKPPPVPNRPQSLGVAARDLVLLTAGSNAAEKGESERAAIRALASKWRCNHRSLWAQYQRVKKLKEPTAKMLEAARLILKANHIRLDVDGKDLLRILSSGS